MEATRDGRVPLVLRILKAVAPVAEEVDETRIVKAEPVVKPVAEMEATLLDWRVLLRIAKEAVAVEPVPVSNK